MAGALTRFEYDGLYRVREKILPELDPQDLPYKEVSSFDKVGNRETFRDANGKTTLYQYDKLNRLVRTQDAAGNVTTVTYQDLELGAKVNKAQEHDETRGLRTTFKYDPQDREIERKVHLEGEDGVPGPGPIYTTTTAYPASEHAVVVTLQPGRTTKTLLDGLDRPVQQTVDPGGLNLRTRDVLRRPGQPQAERRSWRPRDDLQLRRPGAAAVHARPRGAGSEGRLRRRRAEDLGDGPPGGHQDVHVRQPRARHARSAPAAGRHVRGRLEPGDAVPRPRVQADRPRCAGHADYLRAGSDGTREARDRLLRRRRGDRLGRREQAGRDEQARSHDEVRVRRDQPAHQGHGPAAVPGADGGGHLRRRQQPQDGDGPQRDRDGHADGRDGPRARGDAQRRPHRGAHVRRGRQPGDQQGRGRQGDALHVRPCQPAGVAGGGHRPRLDHDVRIRGPVQPDARARPAGGGSRNAVLGAARLRRAAPAWSR